METVLTVKVLANVKDLKEAMHMQTNLGTHLTLPKTVCHLYHSLYGLKQALEAWLV